MPPGKPLLNGEGGHYYSVYTILLMQ